MGNKVRVVLWLDRGLAIVVSIKGAAAACTVDAVCYVCSPCASDVELLALSRAVAIGVTQHLVSSIARAFVVEVVLNFHGLAMVSSDWHSGEGQKDGQQSQLLQENFHCDVKRMGICWCLWQVQCLQFRRTVHSFYSRTIATC